MPRFPRRPAFPGLLALFACLVLLPGVALGAETKTFEDKNFKLVLPSGDWQWHEVGADAAGNGYVGTLYRQAAGTLARVDIRVVPTNGLPLSDLVGEVRDNLSAGLSAVQGTKVEPALLSGLDCSLVLIKGRDKEDHPLLIKAYTLEAGGLFHQMMFFLTNGAEDRQAKEIDALRRGYRLLKGAGPEEKEPENPDKVGDIGDGQGTGPTQEGNTLTFPSHNVKWSIPDGSKFKWTSVARNEGMERGVLCRAEAAVQHDPPEGSQDKQPVVNRAEISLQVYPQPAGWTPALVARSTQYTAEIEKQAFDKVDYGRLRVVEDMEIGNVRGGGFQMVGWKDGLVRYFQVYAIGLQGQAYEIQAVLTGDGSVDDDFKKDVREMLKSIEFLDTTIWVRGPATIPGVRSFDRDRGKYAGEEKEFKLLGFEAVKPEEMASLEFNPGETGGGLRLAWEMRSDDKQSYLYFDVQSWGKDILLKNKDFFEERIKEREGQWQADVTSPTTVTKGKEAFFKARYGKGKGLGYEFKGYLGQVPFVEQGFLVEYKKYVYWIRYQFGGEDAEKAFSKTLKELKKAIKFES